MGAEIRRSLSIPSMERREAALHDVAAIEQRLDAPPARTCAEAAELAIFLLGTYATMMEARDPQCATDAIERLNEEFRRRIKTQTVPPCAGERTHVALGPARLRPDHHVQGRRLGDPLPPHRALRP